MFDSLNLCFWPLTLFFVRLSALACVPEGTFSFFLGRVCVGGSETFAEDEGEH